MTRVLMVADGAWPTGFERVARGIGTHLQANGFEVIHRALGYTEKMKLGVAPYPYEVRPTTQAPQDPMAVMRMPTWIEEDKPDVVLMIQDLWNQMNYLGYIPRDLPSVGYFPVDTPNIKWSYAMAAAALTEAVPYTQFGARETALGVRDAVDMLLSGYTAQGVDLFQRAAWLTLPKDGMELHMRVDRLAERQNPEGYQPIAHGIDHTMFSAEDKAACRRVWGFPQDAFIVLNVNTNQFRKRQDLTMRAFALLTQKIPNALLVLHCMGSDREGWDLGQLARLYGIQDKVICTHWKTPQITDEQLVLLYNSADVQINTGGGEGWGLTSVEGALCGVPQLVPNWSATREIWSGSGVLLPVTDYRIEPKYINTAHALVDTRKTADLLVGLAKDADWRSEVGAACQKVALAMPSWDQVGEAFARRVRRALQEPEPLDLPLASLPHKRTKELSSELLQFDRNWCTHF